MKDNKDHHRKGQYRWGEPKHPRNLSLTEHAWNWLKALGGSDYIERKARGKREKKHLT